MVDDTKEKLQILFKLVSIQILEFLSIKFFLTNNFIFLNGFAYTFKLIWKISKKNLCKKFRLILYYGYSKTKYRVCSYIVHILTKYLWQILIFYLRGIFHQIIYLLLIYGSFFLNKKFLIKSKNVRYISLKYIYQL